MAASAAATAALRSLGGRPVVVENLLGRGISPDQLLGSLQLSIRGINSALRCAITAVADFLSASR